MSTTRTVSNKFYVTAIAGNETMSAALYTKNSLTQSYTTSTGGCFPNWTSGIDSNFRPTNLNSPWVYSIVKVNGELQSVISPKWYYNNVPLTFDPTTHLNLAATGVDAGTFYFNSDVANAGMDVDGDNPGPKQPLLLVVDNLATSANPDNDVITLTGSVEVSGSTLAFTVNQPVRITQTGGTGYEGVVGGDQIVVSTSTPASMWAILSYGGAAVESFSTKWYREGIDTDASTGDWPKVVNSRADSGGEHQGYPFAPCTISEADIFDNVILRVDFYSGQNASGQLLCTTFWEVDDQVDDDEMRIVYDLAAENGENSFVKKGKNVDYYFWMSKASNPAYVNPKFTTWKLRITDNTSKLVKIKGGSSENYVISDGTNDEISVALAQGTTLPNGSSCQANQAGRAIIGYDFTVAHGYTISGHVIATGTL